MTRWAIRGAAIGALLLAHSRAVAQAPLVPATPAVPAAVPAAPASNIWSKICLTPEQKEKCRQHLCNFPLTPLLGGMLAPARAYSGGLLPPLCPGPNDPNPADKDMPADSAQGAADRIKRREAEAKARIAAVRYLGTVDCRRYPEAEAALINSLRADENECVRFEAALALANGCCCTRKIIEALTLTVSGKKSNDPAETSPRVKAAAARALERCLACYTETATPTPLEAPPARREPAAPPEVPVERLDSPPPAKLPPPITEGPAGRFAPDPTLEDARRALSARTAPQPTCEPPRLAPQPANEPILRVSSRTPASVASVAPPRPANGLPPTGQRDLWSLFRNAVRGQ